MSVSSDIVQSWRKPRMVMQRHLQRPVSEPFAFSLLVAFLVLAFVALWPQMSRETVLHPEVPMVQRIVAAALAFIATVPLWYGFAALSHWTARVLGGQGSHYRARLALFAALVAVSPGMLLRGLVAGMIGPGLQLNIVGGIVALGFLWIWLSMLAEAERAE